MAEYQIWCESCAAWVSEFEVELTEPTGWLCCDHCGEGLVKVIH